MNISFFNQYLPLAERGITLAEATKLQFPLNGQTNRPVYDAVGQLVSIPRHAPMFVAAVNLVHELATTTKWDSATLETVGERARQILRMQ